MRAQHLLGGVIIAALVTSTVSGAEVPDKAPIAPAGLLFGRCLGDCDGDEAVTIDELLRGVRIALGESPRSVCEAGGTGSFISGISALTTAVRNALLGCVTERDVSDFGEFEWQQAPALGFCPVIGSLASAHLSRIGDAYRLATSLIAARDPLPDECMPTAFQVDCFTAQPQPCRLLTAEEAVRVRDAFTRVRVQTGPDASCLDLIVDPCVIKMARWDDASFSDYPHSSDRLDDTEMGGLEDLVESLGSGPEVACP